MSKILRKAEENIKKENPIKRAEENIKKENPIKRECVVYLS